MLGRQILVVGTLVFATAPVLVAASEGAAPTFERKVPEGPPSGMSNAEIAAHNEGLEFRHPDFIKCRKIDMIGSLVKKARVCRTNEQWAQSWEKGNRNVRDTADAYAPKFQDCRNNGGC